MARPASPPAMSPAELRAAGELLYGERFLSDLARALGTRRARINSFLLPPESPHHRRIPAEIREQILELLRSRGRKMIKMADQLARES